MTLAGIRVCGRVALANEVHNRPAGMSPILATVAGIRRILTGSLWMTFLVAWVIRLSVFRITRQFDAYQ